MMEAPDYKFSNNELTVLLWLQRYPTVRIHYSQYDAIARFNPYWINGDAMKHMVSTVRTLGQAGLLETDESTFPDTTKAISRGTPRCTLKTFCRLYGNGLLEHVGKEEPNSQLRGYALSAKGRAALSQIAKRG